jgi:hypothetical protein
MTGNENTFLVFQSCSCSHEISRFSQLLRVFSHFYNSIETRKCFRFLKHSADARRNWRSFFHSTCGQHSFMSLTIVPSNHGLFKTAWIWFSFITAQIHTYIYVIQIFILQTLCSVLSMLSDKKSYLNTREKYDIFRSAYITHLEKPHPIIVY